MTRTLLIALQPLFASMHYVWQYLPPAPVEDDHLLLAMLRDANNIGHPNVSEIYSPPRVTSLAKSFGLRAGCALDLSVVDEDDGMPWDVCDTKKTKKAMKLIQTTTPAFIILSPMCKGFSTLQNLSRARIGQSKADEMLRRARVHLSFCMQVAKHQLAVGNYCFQTYSMRFKLVHARGR